MGDRARLADNADWAFFVSMPNCNSLQWRRWTSARAFGLVSAQLPYQLWLLGFHLAKWLGFPPANLLHKRDRVLFGHSLSNTTIECFHAYPSNFTPFSHRLGFPIYGDESIFARVPGLFLRRGPLAVFWRIALRIIYSVKRMLVARSTPHVCKKVLVGVTPAVANRDALGSIPTVRAVFGTMTSREHLPPGTIFRGTWFSLASAMRRIAMLPGCLAASYAHVSSIAAAAFHFAICKLIRRNVDLLAAQAFAMPDNLLSPSQIRRGNSGESSKNLVREIMFYAHLAIMPQ